MSSRCIKGDPRSWQRRVPLLSAPASREEVTHFVHQTAAYRTLVEGQTGSIVVDPLRPRSGFIADCSSAEGRSCARGGAFPPRARAPTAARG